MEMPQVMMETCLQVLSGAEVGLLVRAFGKVWFLSHNTNICKVKL